MRIIGKAPCEDPQRAIATMDFPSKERFLFVGGPLDGKRCHVEMTTHSYIRHPMHERDGKIHFIYQHGEDRRNIIFALIEGYRPL